MNFFVLFRMLAPSYSLIAVAAVAWLASLCTGETVELKGGKKIEFTADLERAQSWGVQFQLVEGTTAFRVGALMGRHVFEGSHPTRTLYFVVNRA